MPRAEEGEHPEPPGATGTATITPGRYRGGRRTSAGDEGDPGSGTALRRRPHSMGSCEEPRASPVGIAADGPAGLHAESPGTPGAPCPARVHFHDWDRVRRQRRPRPRHAPPSAGDERSRHRAGRVTPRSAPRAAGAPRGRGSSNGPETTAYRGRRAAGRGRSGLDRSALRRCATRRRAPPSPLRRDRRCQCGA